VSAGKFHLMQWSSVLQGAKSNRIHHVIGLDRSDHACPFDILKNATRRNEDLSEQDKKNLDELIANRNSFVGDSCILVVGARKYVCKCSHIGVSIANLQKSLLYVMLTVAFW
jgi:hypothetical protein